MGCDVYAQVCDWDGMCVYMWGVICVYTNGYLGVCSVCVLSHTCICTSHGGKMQLLAMPSVPSICPQIHCHGFLQLSFSTSKVNQ